MENARRCECKYLEVCFRHLLYYTSTIYGYFLLLSVESICGGLPLYEDSCLELD